MTVTPIKDTFSAVFYETRGPIHGRLVVHGEVELPTPGWHPHLVFANPQGINPHILLLNLEATKPTGIVPQHVVKEEVSFVSLAANAISEVSIENHQGSGLTIKVRTTVHANQ